MNIKNHVNKLGLRAKDKVTGIEGVITHVGFDLYGCVQVILHPGTDEKGVVRETLWLDIARLTILQEPRVMPVPDYEFGLVAEGKKGPGERPKQNKC